MNCTTFECTDDLEERVQYLGNIQGKAEMMIFLGSGQVIPVKEISAFKF